MDKYHSIQETLVQAAAAEISAIAIAAFIVAGLAFLSGEFVDTRVYLLALALVSALLAFALGMWLSRHGAPGRR